MIASGATLSIDTDADNVFLSGGRTLQIDSGATASWSGQFGIGLAGAATIENAGTFNANGGVLFDNGGGGLIHNAATGTFSKSAGPATLTVGVPFDNDGTVEIATGILGAASYTQSATGTLQVRIAGTAPGTGFGQLKGGTAALDGTLRIVTASGFTPAIGDSFRIVDASSRTGVFSTVEGATTDGLEYSVQYDDTGVTLVVGTAPNDPPIADAGPDQTVASGAPVTLDGSGSTDPDAGDTLNYAWSQTSGPAVTLSDPTAVSPTFTAPAGPATLTFDLTVCDRPAADPDQLCDTDSVTVNVSGPGNTAPIADAGPDQTVASGAPVTLDGSGSTDPDAGDTLNYAWSQTSGPAVTLSDPTAVSPTFTAPAGPATLTFDLTVCDRPAADPDQLCDTDSVTVNVSATGQHRPDRRRRARPDGRLRRDGDPRWIGVDRSGRRRHAQLRLEPDLRAGGHPERSDRGRADVHGAGRAGDADLRPDGLRSARGRPGSALRHRLGDRQRLGDRATPPRSPTPGPTRRSPPARR